MTIPTDSPENNPTATTRQENTPLSFAIEARIPGAGGRAGTLTLPHGTVETPAFMVVGTQATVKSLTPDELRGLGTQMILGNAYHLYLRPGAALVEEFGGLHKFMGWDGPILTDSGGFQVFSLGFALEHGVGKIAKIFPGEGSQAPKRAQRPKLTRIDDDGVTFTSHLDGSTHRFTPEVSIGIQQQLGADVIVAFDECTSPLHDHAYTARALDRTHRWADRCLGAPGPAATIRRSSGSCRAGPIAILRLQSAEFFASRPFPGYCIGGSLGKRQRRYARDPRLDATDPARRAPAPSPRDRRAGRFLRRRSSAASTSSTASRRPGSPATGRSTPPMADSRSKPRAIPTTKGRSKQGCGCYTCQHFSRGLPAPPLPRQRNPGSAPRLDP